MSLLWGTAKESMARRIYGKGRVLGLVAWSESGKRGDRDGERVTTAAAAAAATCRRESAAATSAKGNTATTEVAAATATGDTTENVKRSHEYGGKGAWGRPAWATLLVRGGLGRRRASWSRGSTTEERGGAHQKARALEGEADHFHDGLEPANQSRSF